MNLPTHIITYYLHPWTYPLMAHNPLIQVSPQMPPNNTHKSQFLLRLEALAQAIRPGLLKLGSLAWASVWQWQCTKTRLGEGSLHLNPNLSPRRRVLQPPATPHDFLLRRATLAWARCSVTQNLSFPLERDAQAETGSSLSYPRLGEACSLERK